MWYYNHMCIHYDLEHFVYGIHDQYVFSKLTQWNWRSRGYTALIEACRHGHVETARVLLDHGTNIDHQNKVEKNVLMVL